MPPGDSKPPAVGAGIALAASSSPARGSSAMRRTAALLFACVVLAIGAGTARPADVPAYTRQEDVIYGRKFGTALTMDVFTPKQNANSAAVVWVVSGGWFSAHEVINAGTVSLFIAPLLARGYTVFAVIHGSQPKFTIPEAIADLNRAVR